VLSGDQDRGEWIDFVGTMRGYITQGFLGFVFPHRSLVLFVEGSCSILHV
jgi:hypothetical protein